MSTAAERVRAYLDARPDVGEFVAALSTGTETIGITAADLRTLVIQAEALRHSAPHAARAIEVGPS